MYNLNRQSLEDFAPSEEAYAVTSVTMFVLIPALILCMVAKTSGGNLIVPERFSRAREKLIADTKLNVIPTSNSSESPPADEDDPGEEGEEEAEGAEAAGADGEGALGPWPQEGAPAAWESVVSTALHAPAALLLALTLAATAALPALRATPHARALACHAVALCAATLLQLWWSLRKDPPDPECFAALLVYQFSYLSAYFWLNAMCVDMYLAFRQLTGARSGESSRFLAYSLYAWGFPAAVAGATAAVQFTLDPQEDALLMPFNPNGCYFRSNEGLFLYLYGPVLLLLLVNLLLFVLTATRIHQLHRDTAAILDPEERSTALCSQGRAMLYVRLLWSMGVMEMAVELMSWDQGRGPMSLCIRSVVDLCRALSVFAVACCRAEVLRGLRQLRAGRSASRAGTGSAAPTRQNSLHPQRRPPALHTISALVSRGSVK